MAALQAAAPASPPASRPDAAPRAPAAESHRATGGGRGGPLPALQQQQQEPQEAQEQLSALEELQPDVLYHVLVCLRQQDVAHVKMCSSRLRSSILRACQHWAPKVESWLASDPSAARLLQQLRGAGSSQPLPSQPPRVAAAVASSSGASSSGGGGAPGGGTSLVVGSRTFAAVAAAAAAQDAGGNAPSRKQPPATPAAAPRQQAPAAVPAAAAGADQLMQLLACKQQQAAGSGAGAPALMIRPPASLASTKLDWRQVWSCLERAQQGPWHLDVRRLTPAAFPHGVLITFELLLQQPAPPLEPGGSREAAGWRDSVTVLSFALDGKTVEIMVDASGRLTSPQKDWCQGAITLQAGQPKLLALEVSYIFPVPAWYLHPCTLAAPKADSGMGSSGSSCTLQDANWDSHSLGASSSSSGSGAGGASSGGSSGASLAHSAALTSAFSSLSFTSATAGGRAASSSGSLSTTSGGSSGSSAGGRPRLCLDLSHGLGSYVIDPRFIDDAARNQRPRGLERLELAGRVCWRPNKVQTWLGRLLPGIRSHSSSSSSGCRTACNGGSSHSSSAASAAAGLHSTANGALGLTVASGGAGSGGGSSTATSSAISVGGPGSNGSCSGSVPCGGGGQGGSSSKTGAPLSFAVTVSKAAVWQVPEDPEFRFSEGFCFWAVQHKAEQLLGHYGIL